jgi:hypothetical protein
VKLGPCDGILTYGIIRLVWNTGWMLHWAGNSRHMATGEMILVILKGLWHHGASLTVPYGNGRFFPSSQTNFPFFHFDGGTIFLYATLLRVWMARRWFCQILERYSSAVKFLDSAHCCMDSGGSHPINSSLGAKLVVEFWQLLWTVVAMGSHLLHSF